MRYDRKYKGKHKCSDLRQEGHRERFLAREVVGDLTTPHFRAQNEAWRGQHLT